MVPIGIGALGLLVLIARLSIEWQWFGEFGAQQMLLRRWLLQVVAFVVVMALFLWVSDKTLEWVLYDLVLGWKNLISEEIKIL